MQKRDPIKVCFAAWLRVARPGIGEQLKALAERDDLPESFATPDSFVDWLTDHRIFGDPTLARLAWRRFVNWRARRLGTNPPRFTKAEREQHQDTVALREFLKPF
jgi:hypothetical protein